MTAKRKIPRELLKRFQKYMGQYRQDLGLSQEQLAERSGIPLSKVRKIEDGKVNALKPEWLPVTVRLIAEMQRATDEKDQLERLRREADADGSSETPPP